MLRTSRQALNTESASLNVPGTITETSRRAAPAPSPPHASLATDERPMPDDANTSVRCDDGEPHKSTKGPVSTDARTSGSDFSCSDSGQDSETRSRSSGRSRTRAWRRRIRAARDCRRARPSIRKRLLPPPRRRTSGFFSNHRTRLIGHTSYTSHHAFPRSLYRIRYIIATEIIAAERTKSSRASSSEAAMKIRPPMKQTTEKPVPQISRLGYSTRAPSNVDTSTMLLCPTRPTPLL